MSDAAAPGERPVVLEAKGLRKSYQLAHETIPVLDGLDLTVRAGERVAVVGASGSGKSTMVHILGLLDRPDGGSLDVAGADALAASDADRSRMRNASIGFVFQFYHLVPELTALENVILPGRIGAGWFGWGAARRSVTERAHELLGKVGLGGRERHRPSQLSGGERQRVAIARSLVQNPDVLFCDEPTGNLDPRTARGVQDLLLGLDDGRRAILLVTHDETFAKRCHRSLRMLDGRLVASES